MTLFEDFVEPFTDLSQWTVTGSVGTDPTVAAGAVVFPVSTGEHYDKAIHSVDGFDLVNSWFSFRVKSVGSYAQGVIGEAGTEQGPLLILNDYPGLPGLSLNKGATLVTLPADSQPIVLYYADETTATIAYSTDEGATWDTFNTYDLSEIVASDSEHITFGAFPFAGASEDYSIEYDQINQYNLDGPVGGGVTEVYAADLVSAWNTRTVVTAADLVSRWHVRTIVTAADLVSTWLVVNVTTAPHGYLRHSTRHATQSMIDHLTYQLGLLSWTDPDNVPFGADAVAITDGFPNEWDEVSVLGPGMLVITVGDEAAVQEEELGPLASIEIPFFIDCFMDTDGVTLALANDVRDILCGRFAGTTANLDVLNYNYSEPFTSGYVMEFDDVIRTRVKNKWHVVKVSAQMFFNDVREEAS